MGGTSWVVTTRRSSLRAINGSPVTAGSGMSTEMTTRGCPPADADHETQAEGFEALVAGVHCASRSPNS